MIFYIFNIKYVIIVVFNKVKKNAILHFKRKIERVIFVFLWGSNYLCLIRS